MQSIRPENKSQTSNWTSTINTLVNHPIFFNGIIVLIVINAILVGLETYPAIYESYQSWFVLADNAFLWIFTVEIILRLIAAKPITSFFKDGWNLFDFVIVLSGHIFVGAHFVTVLRILRILRILRTISTIPSLRKLVNALLMTIPSLGNIMILLSLFFYIFAVMGTMFFASTAPEYFGSLNKTLLTLFQVVTLESWASDVMRPIAAEISWAWIYFVAFILVGSFVIFNLFIGVIVSNVDKCEEEEEGCAKEALASLQKEVRELKQLILELQAVNKPSPHDKHKH